MKLLWVMISVLFTLLVASRVDVRAQQALPQESVSTEPPASTSIIGKWEAQNGEHPIVLQVTLVLPDGRIFGSHRLSDFADGRREYYPFEGKRTTDGKYTYTVSVESGRDLTYVLWREGDTLYNHIAGSPDLGTTFTRLP